MCQREREWGERETEGEREQAGTCKMKCANTSCAQSIYAQCLCLVRGVCWAKRFTCVIIVYNKWILLGITHTIIAIYIFFNFFIWHLFSLPLFIRHDFLVAHRSNDDDDDDDGGSEKRSEKRQQQHAAKGISVYFTLRSWVFYMENPVNIHLFSFKISFCVPVVYS